MKKFSVCILTVMIALPFLYIMNFPAFAEKTAKADDKASDNNTVAVGRKVQFLRNIYAVDSRGEPDQQKSVPKGIALDKEGKLFVIFFDLMEVQVFDSKGKFLYRFGKKGLEEGAFWLPLSLEVADNGTVFVLDSHLNKILAFSNGGEFLYEFNFRKRRLPDDKSLMRCTKMGLDRKNNILYLSDSANSNIKLFSLKGDFMGIFPWDTEKAGALAVPMKISFDSHGNIYIPDFLNGEVYVYNSKKEYLFTFGGLGDRLGNFARPVAVSVDDEENIYALDRVLSVIQIFNSRGDVLGVIKDTEVSGGLRFTKPFDMVMDSRGVIYLSSQSQHCIKVLREITR